MFLKGWRARECIAAFENLAGGAFRRGPLTSIPLPSSVTKALALMFNDALYDGQSIDQALREAYGGGTRILDASYATSIGAKVCLPVATIGTPIVTVITNYNGSGDDDTRFGMCICHSGCEWSVR